MPKKNYKTFDERIPDTACSKCAHHLDMEEGIYCGHNLTPQEIYLLPHELARGGELLREVEPGGICSQYTSLNDFNNQRDLEDSI